MDLTSKINATEILSSIPMILPGYIAERMQASKSKVSGSNVKGSLAARCTGVTGGRGGRGRDSRGSGNCKVVLILCLEKTC